MHLKRKEKKNAAEELRNINVREQQIALRERKAVSRLPIAAATKLTHHRYSSQTRLASPFNIAAFAFIQSIAATHYRNISSSILAFSISLSDRMFCIKQSRYSFLKLVIFLLSIFSITQNCMFYFETNKRCLCSSTNFFFLLMPRYITLACEQQLTFFIDYYFTHSATDAFAIFVYFNFRFW